MILYEIETQRRLLLGKLAAIDAFILEGGRPDPAERDRIVAALDENAGLMPTDVVLRSQSLDERHAPLKPNTIRRQVNDPSATTSRKLS